jgi:hypothetical protein
VVGDGGDAIVDLGERPAMQELLKHAALKNLDELQLTAPLDFKAFELRQRAILRSDTRNHLSGK